jgi:hypothetical protein
MICLNQSTNFCTILLWIWVFNLYTLKYMNTVCLFGCDPEAPAYGLNIRSGTIFQVLEDSTSNPWVLVCVLSLLLIVIIIIVIIASVYLRLFLSLSWLPLVFFPFLPCGKDHDWVPGWLTPKTCSIPTNNATFKCPPKYHQILHLKKTTVLPAPFTLWFTNLVASGNSCMIIYDNVSII